MGNEAVALSIPWLVACGIFIFFWIIERKKVKHLIDHSASSLHAMSDSLLKEVEKSGKYVERITQLEAEILRLRKNPLQQQEKVVDNAEGSVIRAKSAAQVRQITEQVWGKQPEIGTGEIHDAE